MKIHLKTITGKQQTLDVEDTATIKVVKEHLKDEYDIATLRLCFNGEVVGDDVTIESLGMTEKDAFVIAGKKSKVARAGTANQQQQKQQEEAENKLKQQQQQQQSAPTTTESSAETANTNTSSPTPTAMPSPPATAPSPPATAPAGTGSSNAPPVAAGAVNKELVDNLVAMGFEDRAQVALALQAAFMNVDRAVEYLCTGIPAGAQRALQDSMMMNQHMAGGGAVSEVSNSQLRAALNAIPQFGEIKATYKQNREVLPVILEQMAQRYPDLYTMVMSDIEGFQHIMEEEDDEEGFTDAVEATSNLVDRMPPDMGMTQEDRDAVVNLVEIGGGAWDQQAALLVYLACRRDQEIAASVLLEHGGVPPELLAEILAQQQQAQEFDD